MKIMNMVKKCVAVAVLVVSMSAGTTAMAAEIVVTPVQATFMSKANTVVYFGADPGTPTELVLPEDFPLAITGVTNNGFWEITINNIKFYIVGDAVKTEAVAAEPTPVSAPATVTVGMKNALNKAKRYIESMSFSYDRLISQLAYEGYTNEECVYAADNCGANWTLECLEKAQNYITGMSFSYDRLISQLAYEKFKAADCIYAADNCGANWYIECAEKAQNYMETMSFSREGLIKQLRYEKFTEDQIAYGITAVGY